MGSQFALSSVLENGLLFAVVLETDCFHWSSFFLSAVVVVFIKPILCIFVVVAQKFNKMKRLSVRHFLKNKVRQKASYNIHLLQ